MLIDTALNAQNGRWSEHAYVRFGSLHQPNDAMTSPLHARLLSSRCATKWRKMPEPNIPIANFHRVDFFAESFFLFLFRS